MWRMFDRNSMEDIRLLESICRNSGSQSVKKEAAYIRRAIYLTKNKPQNLWCWITTNVLSICVLNASIILEGY